MSDRNEPTQSGAVPSVPLQPAVRHRNRIIYINGLHLRDEGIRPLFKWCAECESFVDCYRDAGGPHFMDPSCGIGPIPIKMPNDQVDAPSGATEAASELSAGLGR